MYVDESGFDNASSLGYGYSRKGSRSQGWVKGRATKRMSVIAGQREGKTLAPLVFEGNTNSEIFIKWIKDFLCPELEEGDKVVMDNASFHKSPKIRRILRKVGCGLIYLPPYSPDLNKIEHYWAKAKKYHAKHMEQTSWRDGESVMETLVLCPNLIG
ncbi:MAG: IS630 family transposase [Spirochaetota bacterium]